MSSTNQSSWPQTEPIGLGRGRWRDRRRFLTEGHLIGFAKDFARQPILKAERSEWLERHRSIVSTETFSLKEVQRNIAEHKKKHRSSLRDRGWLKEVVVKEEMICEACRCSWTKRASKFKVSGQNFRVRSSGPEVGIFESKKLLTNLFWYRKTKMMKSEAKRCSPNDDQRCSKSFRQSLKGCKFFCEPFELSTIRTPNC